VVQLAVTKFGAIHIVVNCAGIISAGAIMSGKANGAELIKVLKVNVLGTFLMSKFASLQMIKQDTIGEFKERGVIINVASVAGIEG